MGSETHKPRELSPWSARRAMSLAQTESTAGRGRSRSRSRSASRAQNGRISAAPGREKDDSPRTGSYEQRAKDRREKSRDSAARRPPRDTSPTPRRGREPESSPEPFRQRREGSKEKRRDSSRDKKRDSSRDRKRDRSHDRRRESSRDRKRNRSKERRRERSAESKRENRERDRSRDRRRDRSTESKRENRERGHSRDRRGGASRERRRDRSKDRRRDGSKDKRRDRSKDRRQGDDRDRSKDRRRDRSKDRRRANDRDGSRDRRRDRSKDRPRHRSRSNPRKRKDPSRSRSRSPLPYRTLEKHRNRSPSPPRHRRHTSRSPIRNKRHKRSPSASPPRRHRAPLPDQDVSFRGLDSSTQPPTKHGGAPTEREKPNFKPTGLLAKEANKVAGTKISLKYHEPPEARKPSSSSPWRLWIFKGADTLGTIELHTQSCWLLGRAHEVADIVLEHPSCSQQHAVIQFRYLEKVVEDEWGVRRKTGRVRPYVIDLESSNGTELNGEEVEGGRYVELRDKDVLRFGGSEREYMVMLPPKE